MRVRTTSVPHVDGRGFRNDEIVYVLADEWQAEEFSEFVTSQPKRWECRDGYYNAVVYSR